ncbi:MAG: type II toxin-antitoxin system RelE/ParE family toxin [Treponema sp.]|nr:type II toxin-antitoxin system RelE/ParE family toxin [Treponema sp.]
MYSNTIERKTPLEVVFYETEQKNQPCRDFLLALSKDDRREVGADIFAAQKGFPLGLPLCRKMETDLWEIRSTVSDGICRVFFTVDGDTMILLHGFKKKSQKTPKKEIDIAENRLKDYKERNK